MRRIIVVFFLAGTVMLFTFNSADWYAKTSAMPRYCTNPGQVVEIVREILTSDRPGEGKERRPYIVSAKLIFLVPQEQGEDIDTYLTRLRIKISQTCGVAF